MLSGNPALELPGLEMLIPIERSNKEIDVCSDGSQTEKIRNLEIAHKIALRLLSKSRE